MITLIQNPYKLTPAYNDIIYVVDSNNNSNTNFKYLCDVRIYNDVTDSYELATRISIYPDVEYGYGIFKIDEILKSYIKDTFHTWRDIPTSSATSPFCKNSTDSIIKYSVEFGEQYSDNSYSPINNYAALYSITDNWTWNAVLDYETFGEYEGHTYNMSTLERKFLTVNKESRIPVNRTDDFYLSFMSRELDNTDVYVNVKTYSGTGVVATYKYQAKPIVTGTTQSHFQSINVGPIGINSSNPDSASNYPSVDWLRTVIAPNITKYDVWLSWKEEGDENLLLDPIDFVDNSGYDNRLGYIASASTFLLINQYQVNYNLSTANNTENIPYAIVSEPLREGEIYEVTFTYSGWTGADNATYWFQFGDTNLYDNSTTPINTLGTYTQTLVARGDCRLRLYMDATINSPAPGLGIISYGSNLIIQPQTYGPISEIKGFVIEDCPAQYERIRLRWLNKLGGHEMYNFDLKTKNDTQVSRNTYSKSINRFNSGVYGSKREDKQKIDYSNTANKTYIANTGWLSSSEIALMQDMIESTTHYIHDEHDVVSFTRVLEWDDLDDLPTQYIQFQIPTSTNPAVYNLKAGDYVTMIFDSMTAIVAATSKPIYYYNKNMLKVVDISYSTSGGIAYANIILDYGEALEYTIYANTTFSGKLYFRKNNIKAIELKTNNFPQDPYTKKNVSLTITYEDSVIKPTRR